MIFNFNDYRSFLKAYLNSLPKHGFGEAKRIASYLSVSSTFVSHVLSGSKSFSTEQAIMLAEYLGLSELENEYFYYLVQLDRSGNQSLKKFSQKKITEIKLKSKNLSKRIEFKKDLSDEQKSIFYSTPLYSAVHLFTSTKDSGVTIEDIQNRFDLNRTKTFEILKFLIDVGLCEQINNHYKMGTQSTHLDMGSPHIIKHHTNWRLRSIQAAENLTSEELMYSVNVSLSKKDFELLRDEMICFIDKFLKTIYKSPSEELACFNRKRSMTPF